MSNYIPTNDYVIIVPIETSPTTSGGILRVEGDKEAYKLGRVLRIGPGIYQNGCFVPTKIKPEQIVMFIEPPNARINWDGANLVLLREPNIVATVEITK